MSEMTPLILGKPLTYWMELDNMATERGWDTAIEKIVALQARIEVLEEACRLALTVIETIDTRSSDPAAIARNALYAVIAKAQEA